MDKERKSEIHITNNFNAPIGQHIDHVDTINFRMDGEGNFQFGMVEEVNNEHKGGTDTKNVSQPVSELLTEKAEVLWERLREAGFIVSEGYALAKGVSANQATYIADCMAEFLGIRNKWKVFEQLWGIKNMAQLAGTWKQTGKEPPRAKEIREILK